MSGNAIRAVHFAELEAHQDAHAAQLEKHRGQALLIVAAWEGAEKRTYLRGCFFAWMQHTGRKRSRVSISSTVGRLIETVGLEYLGGLSLCFLAWRTAYPAACFCSK